VFQTFGRGICGGFLPDSVPLSESCRAISKTTP
jgi:hypothetical protein